MGEFPLNPLDTLDGNGRVAEHQKRQFLEIRNRVEGHVTDSRADEGQRFQLRQPFQSLDSLVADRGTVESESR